MRCAIGGPVHFNAPFRKPLEPQPLDMDYLLPISDWIEGSEPYTHYFSPRKLPDNSELKAVAERMKRAERPLLVLGRMRIDEGALDALIQTLQ